MLTGGEPPRGDFIAYLDKIVGTPPSKPEEMVRLARTISGSSAGADEDGPGDGAAQRAPAREPATRSVTINDIDLALLVPIGRILTLLGIAVVVLAIILGPWLPGPSPIGGVMLIVLGAIVRRIGRGAAGASGKPTGNRKT